MILHTFNIHCVKPRWNSAKTCNSTNEQSHHYLKNIKMQESPKKLDIKIKRLKISKQKFKTCRGSNISAASIESLIFFIFVTKPT